MPYRRRAFSRRRGMSPVIETIKNTVSAEASTGITLGSVELAIAKDAPVTTASNEVRRASRIKALWLEIDTCGLAGTGVLQRTGIYLLKNPGANLTAPGVFVVGSSNEKKYIIRQWQFMTMRNQDGNAPNRFAGWIPIPKLYQRMGTDDKWTLVFATSTAAGHISVQCIYKWQI